MHILFVAPHFPATQPRFVRALKEAGAKVTGIGDIPAHSLPGEVRHLLDDYVGIPNVCDPKVLFEAVRHVQKQGWVDRLEAVIEAHMLAAAEVREATGIPGLTLRQVEVCRDKPLMKEVLRQAGVPCAASAAVSSLNGARQFAEAVGYPLILKPRAGAGAAGVVRIDSDRELAWAASAFGLDKGASAAIEEFVEGAEGFYDTLLCGTDTVYDGVSHYFPNVLTAMRDRRHSPKIISTNQIDSNPSYGEVRALGRKVIDALGLHDTATHQEWFFGPKGLRFSEIGARPPGVSFWDVYSAGNDIDLYRMWADVMTHGGTGQRPSRRMASGLMSLRPTQDGTIAGYSGLDEAQARWGEWIFATHLPPVGSSTQSIEAGYLANAWVMMRHYDFDILHTMMSDLAACVTVHAH